MDLKPKDKPRASRIWLPFPNTSIPKMDLIKKLAVSTVRDYHKADINMFWEDIRQNSIHRSKMFLEHEN